MNTTIILGAGASKDVFSEFGLGTELFQQIKERVLDSNSATPYLSKLLNDKMGIRVEQREGFVKALEEYSANVENPSIDQFLSEVDIYPEYAEKREVYLIIGMLAIIFHIVGWESQLKNAYEKGKLKFSDTWIGEIINYIEDKKLLDAYSVSPIYSKSSLQVVTYNYDRLLEYALLNHFEHRQTEISAWIENNIFHVYGKVGYLSDLEFGFDNSNLDKLKSYIGNFKTMYEQRKSNIDKRNIRLSNLDKERLNWDASTAIINASSKLLILGFNYDLYNVKHVFLDQFRYPIFTHIYTDNGDINLNERRKKVSKIREIFREMNFRFKSCKEFLHETLDLGFNSESTSIASIYDSLRNEDIQKILALTEKDTKAKYRPHLKPEVGGIYPIRSIQVQIGNNGKRMKVNNVSVIDGEVLLKLFAPENIDTGESFVVALDAKVTHGLHDLPFKLEIIYSDEIGTKYKSIGNYKGLLGSFSEGVEVL